MAGPAHTSSMRPGQAILVVAHDAGGAEVVSSWVRRHAQFDFRCVVEGPAVSIFKRKAPAIPQYSPQRLHALVEESDFVLTATSGASGLERNAIRASRDAGVRVASYLDHWVNYRERFLVEGELCLPDELWVGDPYAMKIAERIFPAAAIHHEPNPYFQDALEEMGRITAPGRAAGELRVLYLCEPIADQVRQGRSPAVGYDEFEALEHALGKLMVKSQESRRMKVRVRLHPSESAGKYDAVLGRFASDTVEVSRGTALIEDCVWADWVVGCESMAMVIALLAGRRVLCAIPPHGMPCRLPYPEIQALSDSAPVRPAPVPALRQP